MLKWDIDKLVKSALNKNKPAYNEDLWKGIDERLNIANQPMGVSKRWIALAAALLISAGGSIGYYLGKNTLQPGIATTMTVNKSQNTSAAADNSQKNSEKQITNPQFASYLTKNDGEGKNVETLVGSSRRTNKGASAKNGKISSPNFNQSANVNQSTNIPTQAASSPRGGTALVGSPRRINNKPLFSSTSITPPPSPLAATPVFFANRENLNILEIELPEMDLAQSKTSLDVSKETTKKLVTATALQGILYNIWDNPAYSGAEGKSNINAQAKFVAFNHVYRPSTDYFFSFDTHIDKINSGVGVYAVRSISPYLASNTLGAAYSYRIKIDENSALQIGASGSISDSHPYYLSHFENRKSISNGFIFLPNGEPVDVDNRLISANAGIWYEGKNWVSGFSVKNFNSPSYPEGAPISPSYIFTVGYKVNLGAFQLLPTLEIDKINSDLYRQANLMVGYKDILITGLSYQDNNPSANFGDISLYAGVNIKSRIRLFAAYGISTENLQFGSQHKILNTGLRYQIR